MEVYSPGLIRASEIEQDYELEIDQSKFYFQERWELKKKNLDQKNILLSHRRLRGVRVSLPVDAVAWSRMRVYCIDLIT